ncbi:MAG: transketolase [Planctomycetes bacterium]|jgi:transketolase|nr:transketolase [Planctomycetota bacterium]
MGAPRLDPEQLARRVRLHAVQMTSRGRSSHVGSILSCADILATLYGAVMEYRPSEPKWEGRDRFIMSKGHAGAGVYATLAEVGFLSKEVLETHCRNGSTLCGHVATHGIPGVEFSTGSLGHGLPVGAGMAFALQAKRSESRTFVLLSDGELDEGSNWEAFLFAAHHRLERLCVIVDYNKIQSLAPVSETLALEPLVDKLVAFGWETRECDGHDHAALNTAMRRSSTGRPVAVVAHTIKGRGVSFMEHSVLWHYRSPQGDELEAALRELQDPSHA